jgi:ribosomal protein L30E
MLAKTNVHHFSGNNVSILILSFSSLEPNDRRTCLEGLPNEEASSGLRRVIAHADGISQIELGTACGKLYRCSTMAVLDAGDSDILTGSTS